MPFELLLALLGLLFLLSPIPLGRCDTSDQLVAPCSLFGGDKADHYRDQPHGPRKRVTQLLDLPQTVRLGLPWMHIVMGCGCLK